MDIKLYKRFNHLNLNFSEDKSYQSAKAFYDYAEVILDDPSVNDEIWRENIIDSQLNKLSFLINHCPQNKRNYWVSIMIIKINYYIDKYKVLLSSDDKIKLIRGIFKIRMFSGRVLPITNKIKNEYPQLLKYEYLSHELAKKINYYVSLEKSEIKEELIHIRKILLEIDHV